MLLHEEEQVSAVGPFKSGCKRCVGCASKGRGRFAKTSKWLEK